MVKHVKKHVSKCAIPFQLVWKNGRLLHHISSICQKIQVNLTMFQLCLNMFCNMFHYVSMYFDIFLSMFWYVSPCVFNSLWHVSTCFLACLTCFWNVLDDVISSWDVYDKFCCKMFLCSMFPWAMFLCEVPNIWKLIYLLLNSIEWKHMILIALVKVFSMPTNEQVMKFYCQANKSLHFKLWNLNMKNEAKFTRFALLEILNLDATC